jgi:hypothetical protein
MGDRQSVIIKHSSPSGALKRNPSRALTAALRKLTQSDEMKHLITEARAQKRLVKVQVFHSAAGHPILIHLGSVPSDAA